MVPKVIMINDIEDVTNFPKTAPKNFIVRRRVIVELVSDMISCSNPIVAVNTADALCDYELLVRSTSKDGIMNEVNLIELDGAIVQTVDEEDGFYDFEEEDLDEVKAAFGIK
jgi:hypothetical protein